MKRTPTRSSSRDPTRRAARSTAFASRLKDVSHSISVTFKPGIESEPILLAVDTGVDPQSDLAVIERDTVDISRTGTIAGLVFPVIGGAELRL